MIQGSTPVHPTNGPVEFNLGGAAVEPDGAAVGTGLVGAAVEPDDLPGVSHGARGGQTLYLAVAAPRYLPGAAGGTHLLDCPRQKLWVCTGLRDCPRQKQ